MDGRSYCNLVDKLSICTETQRRQLARPFCADPMVTFHVYPEPPNQVTCSEDLSFLPFTSEHLTGENFHSEPCAFPYQMPRSNYCRSEYSYGQAFIRKRNERERQRVKCVNEGYAKLRHHLPKEYLEKRLSKVETLRAAIKYISDLQSVLYSDAVVAEKNIMEPSHTSKAMNKQTQFLKTIWTSKPSERRPVWEPSSHFITEDVHVPGTSQEQTVACTSISPQKRALILQIVTTLRYEKDNWGNVFWMALVRYFAEIRKRF